MTSEALRRFDARSDVIGGPAMRQAFERDGFLVIDDFASSQSIETVRQRVAELVDACDPGTVSTVFSAEDQAHARDAYFRGSGDTIRYFFEDGAFNDDGTLAVDKHRALNKIGHALHDLDPVFSAFSRDERLAHLAAALGQADPGLIQSMLIFKQPSIGGAVGLHQDATFLYTEPVSVIGFWIALEDADEQNGCLYALPGGHCAGLKSRFRYRDGDLVTEMLDPTGFDEEALVPLPAPAGTLVVLDGLVPHGSAPNIGDRSRHAYALHVIDRATRWADDNWLKRAPSMPVRGFADA